MRAVFLAAILMVTACGDSWPKITPHRHHDRDAWQRVDCTFDADCVESFVCEPSGCLQVCTSSSDCLAGLRCIPREYESGSVCERAN